MPSIALTCNEVATYLAAQSDALTFQCLALHLPATKLPLTSIANDTFYQQQSCHIPRSAKRCTYLAMPSIALTRNKVASYLASPDALTSQCQTLHLPATKLLLTLHRKAMHLKRCTYLAMPNIALTCNKVASYLASSSDALTLQCQTLHLPATKLLLTLHRPAMHLPATPRVAITFLQRKALQKPPPQSCPSHISTYHSPCVQPPVR